MIEVPAKQTRSRFLCAIRVGLSQVPENVLWRSFKGKALGTRLVADAEMLPQRWLTKFLVFGKLVTNTGLRMSFLYLVVFELCQYLCDHHPPLLSVSIDLKGLINDHCFLCQKIVIICPIGTSTTNKQETLQIRNYK